jgi:hypothetical protein
MATRTTKPAKGVQKPFSGGQGDSVPLRGLGQRPNSPPLFAFAFEFAVFAQMAIKILRFQLHLARFKFFEISSILV